MIGTFDDETHSYSIDGTELDAVAVKGGSVALSREFKANLSLAAQRLQNQQITLQEAYDTHKRETKLLQMAEYALAMGGIDQVKDWSPVEAILAEQWSGNDEFPGLRAFFEDIDKGRYGPPDRLSSAVLSRSAYYSNAGRLTYENSLLAAKMGKAEREAKRIKGAVDNCEDCPVWANFGWIDAAVMLARYYIGASVCRMNCFCSIVTRRKAIDARQAVGRNAVLSLMQNVARVAGGGAAVVGALALFRYAANNPVAVQFALSLLLRAVEGERVNV